MKFQAPKGTRDFLTEEMIKREFVMNTIKNILVKYGFDPLETPTFENFEVLAIKGGLGEDIKKQVFNFKDKAGRELGLRPELTIGMTRVIANNPQLPKPFKRYCIAPVWRYEEITAGRKREFYQCDIDVVGTESMEAEIECIACSVDCLKALGFKKFEIKINNRKILEGFLELIKKRVEPEIILEFSSVEVFRAIDKISKIGLEGVKGELKKIGLEGGQIDELLKIISIRGSFEDVLEKGREVLKGIKIAEDGIKELEEVFRFSKIYGISDFLKLDFGLARGLDYYTGPIFEIAIKTKRNIGSIAGGGRYDNLIELLGGRTTPATGISLGIERIIEIMKDEEMFNLPKTKVKVFVANVGEKVKDETIKIAQKLREKGISSQTDLMSRNLTKQLEFADSLGIPYCLIVGEKEIKNKKFKFRNMKKKVEKELTLEQIIKIIK